MSKNDDDPEIEARQLVLVNWQQHAMTAGEKVLIIFEGRDAAGKDGAIRVLTEHLSVRNTKVVALPKPSDRERSQWYFQRYIPYLPASGETVIFNRSWYNRAGVERVMGFSTPDEQEVFLREAPTVESMLIESGLRIVKFWLEVSKDEQAKRLAERHSDPLKALKSSPLDDAAQKKWDAYSEARNIMLQRTSTALAPWICVRSDHKRKARLAIMSYLAHTLAPAKIAADAPPADPAILFRFESAALRDGRLEK